MKIKNVLIDIDGTLSYERNPYLMRKIPKGGNYFNQILVEMLVEKTCLTREEALAEVFMAEDTYDREDPFCAVRDNPQWGISELAFWKRCRNWQNKHLFFYRDSMDMVRELHRKGFRLFIASNNGTSGILMKLSRAGLADRKRVRFFSDIFGDDLAGCQKSEPDYFHSLLRRFRLDTEATAMVGDSLEQDLLVPSRAGLKYFVIVDRKRKSGFVEKNGVFFTTDLRRVPAILEGIA